ncbi:MAG: transcriptional regulator [Terracidiphilus sp.]|jgi:DNA-binding phage protein|nr:transcriptional regulator [Terracidiphilus sp.]
MPLTRSFSETIREQLAGKKFRRELLREAVTNLLANDLDTAKALLREYINGTVGFVELGEALEKSPKSLMRMLSPTGNPHARNLLEIVAYLQQLEGASFRITIAAAA